MSLIYKVGAKERIHPASPLHVNNFYRSKERLHRSTMEERQQLILYLAKLHTRALAPGMPRGFCTVKLRLTSLREWVYDYRPALDFFFEVQELGFNLGDAAHEVSTLVPKHIGDLLKNEVESVGVTYLPPPRPLQADVVSKVYVRQERRNIILSRLRETGRLDLAEPVEFLLGQPEHNFIFKPAGKLQQRDTSVWPVAAIETWPGWLREELFGPGIDIESAYTQYLVQHLREIYIDRPQLLKLIYPNLMAQIEDKQAWRVSLCRDVLGLEPDAEALSLVKKVCMSLANGSRISPAILSSGTAFSITAEAIIKQVDDVSLERLEHIGSRLRVISSEYSNAKKIVCNHLLRLSTSRANQKKVFASYFEWERVARYLIWEAIDHHGIMVHDGIDGVPERYLARLPELMAELGIKVST